MKVLGITDEVTTCECCGKTNLKRTVVLESEATGIVHYGTDCAAATLFGKKSRSNRDMTDKIARGVQYAQKYIGKYGREPQMLQRIADYIRVYFCNASVVNGQILIYGNVI